MILYILNIFWRYVTLGRPPPPLSQSVTLGRPPPPRERYVIVEWPLTEEYLFTDWSVFVLYVYAIFSR